MQSNHRKMNSQSENRFGLILNFFGTFLIAPELIGKRRLAVIECKIQSLLTEIKSAMDGYVNWIFYSKSKTKIDVFDKESYVFRSLLKYLFIVLIEIGVILSVLIVYVNPVLWIMEWWRIISISIVLTWGLISIYLIIYHFHIFPYRNYGGFVDLLIDIGCSPLYVFLSPVIMAYFLFISFVLLFFHLPFGICYYIVIFMNNQLMGNDKLRPFLIWIGVIFLMVGFALQFIATF